MRKSFSLHGVIVPLVTPFNDQNQVDHARLRNVVDFVISKGVHAVMVAGTTGEGPLLSMAERKQVLETVVDQTNKRVPVIAHTGGIDTCSTVELSQHAAKAGADVVSAIVPYFFTFSQEQIYRHFLTVAESVPDTPMLLYAFPGNAKNDILPPLGVACCRRHPTLSASSRATMTSTAFKSTYKWAARTLPPVLAWMN